MERSDLEEDVSATETGEIERAGMVVTPRNRPRSSGAGDSSESDEDEDENEDGGQPANTGRIGFERY